MNAPRRRSVLYRNSELNDFLRSRSFSRRDTVFGLFGVIAIVGWIHVVLMSDAFQINDVRATGLQALDELDVTKEVFRILDAREGWRPWPKRHSWFLDQKDLENVLKERLFAANVTVKKGYGQSIEIAVEERAKRIVFHSRQQYAWVDLHGVVTSELDDAERKDAQARLLGQRAATAGDAPIIKRNLEENVSQGFTAGDSREVKEWIELHDNLKRAGMLFREFTPPSVSSTQLDVLAQNGEEVRMDITASIEMQVKTYQAFKKTKEGAKKIYDYIDVRVPGRVYVKE